MVNQIIIGGATEVTRDRCRYQRTTYCTSMVACEEMLLSLMTLIPIWQGILLGPVGAKIYITEIAQARPNGGDNSLLQKKNKFN